MIYFDMHVHSIFSEDSEEKIDDLCKAAIEKGVKGICITDHIDYNPNDFGFGYYDKNGYLRTIEEAKMKYKDELLVLSGIEFSEPHLYSEELKEIHKDNYDVILGSVHWIGDAFVGQRSMFKDLSEDEIVRLYYDMILKMIEFGGFDVLAHLDFPKRYYGATNIERDKIIEILKKIIEKDIALEINTSSLRKGNSDSMPAVSLVEEYIRLGGRKLTLGSDAHKKEDIAADFESVIEKLSDTGNASIGLYKGRKFILSEELI